MAARFLYFQQNLSAPRSSNLIRRGENPLGVLSDREFLKEYRMTKEEIRWLCSLLSDDLNSCGNRGCDLTTEEKSLDINENVGLWQFSKLQQRLFECVTAYSQ